MMKTQKQKVVAEMNRPFKEVDKAERRSPLHRIRSVDCSHSRVYQTDAYPTSGPTWVCCDCHKVSDYPDDFSE